jgi:hypothetical protein
MNKENLTISYLEEKVRDIDLLSQTDLSTQSLGSFLCGENWELANYPFSKEFLTNVAYNGKDSMHIILLLQLRTVLSK